MEAVSEGNTGDSRTAKYMDERSGDARNHKDKKDKYSISYVKNGNGDS